MIRIPRKFQIIHIFLLILSFALSACRENPEKAKLMEGERIVAHQPDSARKILKSIDTTRLSADDKMLRRLFLLQAADKLYEEHKNDKEISTLIDYFITRNHVKRVHPLVNYYGGRVYTDLGDDKKALKFFKDALKSLPPATDTDLEGCIHTQLAYLYMAHRMYLHSRNHIQEAIRLSKEENNLVNLIEGSLNLADLYIYQQQMDSAEYVYKNLTPYVNECKDSVTTSTYYSQLAIFYFYDGNLEKADSVIRQHTFVYDDISRASVLSIINKINHACRGEKIDEELYESLLNDRDQTLRYAAHIRLAEMAEQKGDGKGMLRYTKGALRELRSMQKKFNRNSLAEMEKMIDEKELENTNLQLTIDNHKKRNLILFITILAILIIGICLAFIIRGRLKVMKIQMDAYMTLAREKENIMRLLLDGNQTVSETDFTRLREALREVYPNFILTIDGMGLKPKDYQDALLARIDVPQKVCASFFGVTPGGISNQRRRLLQKWQPDGPFHTWKEYLDSL